MYDPIKARKYYAENRERILKKCREYYAKNRARIRQYHRMYYERTKGIGNRRLMIRTFKSPVQKKAPSWKIEKKTIDPPEIKKCEPKRIIIYFN